MIRVGKIAKLSLPLLSLAAALFLYGAAAVAQDATLVRVEKVVVEPLRQTVSVIGRLVALRSGDLAAHIAGPVEEVLVSVGDRVTKDQIVARLVADTLRAEELLAQSELEEAEAWFVAWSAEVDVVRTALKRQQRLRKSSAFSQAKFEDAEKRVAVAVAKLKRARASIEIRRSALERKKLDLGYASIRAPYDGVVVQRFTVAGAFVNRGDRVVRLIGDRALEVEAEVPYKRLKGLPIGRVVDIALDDGSKHKAKVRAVLPSENPLTRTRTMRFEPEFSTIEGSLAESQSVTLAVPIGTDRQVVTVHKDAILKRPTGDMVYVIQDNKALPRQVKLGAELGSRIEVLNGLKEGESVVIRGNERLTPGTTVQVGKGST